MKRTTLVLEEGLLESIRETAHAERRDMSEVVNDLLREALYRKTQPAAAEIRLPQFRMGRPRVNPADRDALEHLMEQP